MLQPSVSRSVLPQVWGPARPDMTTPCAVQFVGHPEYIRDERYERNQFMYNVCFVFDAQVACVASIQACSARTKAKPT